MASLDYDLTDEEYQTAQEDSILDCYREAFSHVAQAYSFLLDCKYDLARAHLLRALEARDWDTV